jgi:translation initiation factor 2B subunit (eIF-2B alpha/beta/delta family)
MNYSTIEGVIRQTTNNPMKTDITTKKKANNTMWNGKPTNFSIKQSLEVVWEAIHEWNEQATDKEYSEDDVKTGMAWIMEELGYGYDKDGSIEKQWDTPL